MTRSAMFGVVLLAATALSLGCGKGADNRSVSPGSKRDVADVSHVESTANSHVGNGELTIYKMSGQTGTVANRVFRNSNGRVLKTIYYTSTLVSPTGPYPEESLRVKSIIIHKYDEQGREQREEHYGPDMTLRRIRDTLYRDADKTIIWRRQDESREYEIRFERKRSVSHLYFDATGENLVSIRGAIPADMDLPYGWGPSVDGIACGLGVTRSQGSLTDFRFYITTRNLTPTPRKVITCLQYHEIKVELRDEEGNLVPQDDEYIRKRDQDLIRMNRGIREATQIIPPNQAETFDGGRELREWYSNLSTGTYYLTVRRRADGPDFPLLSRPIELQVVAQEEQRPQQGAEGDAVNRAP